MAEDVLPESRAREVRGVVRSAKFGNLIPIFCANCGKQWGMVPEHHVTFAYALCDDCEGKHGGVAHLHKEPDAVFWERIANEQREQGVPLTPEILAKQLEDPSSVYSKLKAEWDKHVRKF